MQTKKKLSATAQYLSELIQQMSEESKLKAFNELAEEVQLIDNGMAVALMSGRPELIKMAKPRALTPEECAKLYHLVQVLFETNKLLQQHAQQVGELVTNWTGHFKGLQRAAMEIEAFANFEQLYDDSEED